MHNSRQMDRQGNRPIARNHKSEVWSLRPSSQAKREPKAEAGSRSRFFYSFGGTYSFGLADPSPKKNISICFTITS